LINEVVSITNLDHYYSCGIISSVLEDEKAIIVTGLPFNSSLYDSNSTINKNDYVIYLTDRTDSGEVPFGEGAIAQGISNTAAGFSSVALGFNNKTNGDCGFTAGADNIAGAFSVAVGKNNKATG
jgi:hypothetical protein